MPGGEIQTGEIVSHALSNGKKVYVPYLHKIATDETGLPTSVMDMVTLHSLADFESLKSDKWGIPTIPTETVNERQRILGEQRTATSMTQLDLILMPGMAFNVDSQSKHITRLGHGRGYYDYFMHRYAESQGRHVHGGQSDHPASVALYGLSLKEQFLGAESDLDIPVGPNDVPLDGVLLGTGEAQVASDRASS